MRHVWLRPLTSWYGAPTLWQKPTEPDKRTMTFLENHSGEEKYEFWLEKEDDQFFTVVRNFNDGTKMTVEVMKEKFELEDFVEEKV